MLAPTVLEDVTHYGTERQFYANVHVWDNQKELIFEALITLAEVNERLAKRTYGDPMADTAVEALPWEIYRGRVAAAAWFMEQAAEARELAGKFARAFVDVEAYYNGRRSAERNLGGSEYAS